MASVASVADGAKVEAIKPLVVTATYHNVLAGQADPLRLTSVTMDVCVLKQAFNFSDPKFVQLTANLAGGILRIGGTDGNTYSYDLTSDQPPTPCACGGKAVCTMTRPYWDDVVKFADRTEHALIFGLTANLTQAQDLVGYALASNQSIYAYTYTNEQVQPEITTGYRALRAQLNASGCGSACPRLAGPDVALQRHSSIEAALTDQDASIVQQLEWVREFTGLAAPTLDVVSWHTYDFHADDLGTVDHQPFVASSPNASRFWNTTYTGLAGRLLANMTAIAGELAPHAEVWLTETDSVCHQGVDGATNAYLNSLWLVQRLVLMTERNLTLMARQSLIGYNYSLLGNWPVEPIGPNPDYFTTLLYRTLVGRELYALDLQAADSARTPELDQVVAAVYASARNASQRVLLAANLQANTTLQLNISGFDGSGGSCEEYVLTPYTDMNRLPQTNKPAYESRVMALNGVPLFVDEAGHAPAMPGRPRDACGGVELPPLTFGFWVF